MREKAVAAILMAFIMVISTISITLTPNENQPIKSIEDNKSSESTTSRLTQSADVAFDEGFAFGSNAHDFGYATTRDGNYTYITGKYSGSMTAGATTLTSSGPSDVFVMRVSNEGEPDWLVGFGGNSDDAGYDILFNNDKLWITGYFDDNVDLTTLNHGEFKESFSQRAMFVANLDSTNGDVIEVGVLDGDGDDVASSFTPIDNVFRVAGHSSSSGSLTAYQSSASSSSASSIANSGGADILTASYNPTLGTFSNILATGGTGDDRASGIATIGNPSTATHTAIVGHFGSTVDFDGYSLMASGLGSDGFVASQIPAGTWGWATNASGEMNVQILGVDADHSGNIYVTGEFAGDTLLHSKTSSTPPLTLSSQGFSDAFVGRLSSGGDWQSAKGFGGPFNDMGISVTVDDKHDQVYVAGSFHDKVIFSKGSSPAVEETISGYGNVDGFIAAFSEASLDGIWINDIGGAGRDATMDVAVSEEGRVFMTGYVTGEANAGSMALHGKPGYQDVFYADINPYLPMPAPYFVNTISEGVSLTGPNILELSSVIDSDKVFTIVEMSPDYEDMSPAELTVTITDAYSTWSLSTKDLNFQFTQLVFATQGNRLLWATPLNMSTTGNLIGTDCGGLIDVDSNGNVILVCMMGDLYVSGTQRSTYGNNGPLGTVILNGDTGTYEFSYQLQLNTQNGFVTPKSVSVSENDILVSGSCRGDQVLRGTTYSCGNGKAFVALGTSTNVGFASFVAVETYSSMSQISWVGTGVDAAVSTTSSENRNLSICKIDTSSLDSGVSDCREVNGAENNAKIYLNDMLWNEENGLVLSTSFTGTYSFGSNSRQESIELSNPNSDIDLAVVSLIDLGTGPYQVDWAGTAITNQEGLDLVGLELTEDSVVVSGAYKGDITFGATTLSSSILTGFVASLAGYGNWISVDETGIGIGDTFRALGTLATNSAGDTSYWNAGQNSGTLYEIYTQSSAFYNPDIGSGRTILVPHNTDYSLIPQTKGPAVSYWTIDGYLPSGLEFNTSTGEISGRSLLDPAESAACSTPVITAHSVVPGNSRDSYYGMPVTICITYSDVTNFEYSQTTYDGVYGHPINIPAPTNDGGPVTGYSIATTPPSSLTLDTSTGAYSGTIDSNFLSTDVQLSTTALTGPHATSATTGTSISIDATPTISVADSTWTVSTQFTNYQEIEVDASDATVEHFELKGNDIPAEMRIDSLNGTITWLNVPLLANSPTQVTVNASNSLGSTEITIDLIFVSHQLSLEYQPDSVSVFTNQHIDSRMPVFEYGLSHDYTISPPITVIPGLEFNNYTGRISGEPSRMTTDPVTFTITAHHTYQHPTTGAQVTTGQANFTVNVNPPAPKFNHTTSVIQAVVGHEFSKTFHSTQGEVTEWTLSPHLPSGVYFNYSSGEVYGTGQSTGGSVHTITGSNVDGSDSFTLQLNFIEPTPGSIHYPVNNLSLLTGQEMQPFAPIVFIGEPTWSADAQNPLPAGLSIDSSDGVISGTPTSLGLVHSVIVATSNGESVTYNLTFAVYDLPLPEREVEQAIFTLTINPPAPLFEHTDTEVQVVVGHPFTKTYHSSQGEVTKWTISPQLPTGVYFNQSSGEIYGTGTAVGTTAHSIAGSNINGSDSFMFRLSFVEPEPGAIHYPINNLSLLTSQEMQPFSPIAFESQATWSAMQTHPLPSGLSIDSTNGVISGQPIVTGKFDVVLKATASGTSSTFNLTIVVHNPPIPQKEIQVVNKTIEHRVFVHEPTPPPCNCDNQNVTVDEEVQPSDQTSSKDKSSTLSIMSGVVVALIIGVVLGRITHPLGEDEHSGEKKHESITVDEEEE